MSSLTTFLIILGVLAVAALSVTFGLRRSTREPTAATRPDLEPPSAPNVVETPVVDTPVVDAPVVKARLRDRLGRTRSSFSGYLKGIAGRAIDAAT